MISFSNSIIRSGFRLFLLLFLTFSVLVANPETLLYTVANPGRGLLNREKKRKENVWQHPPPPPPPTPHTARSEKINKIARRIYRRYEDLGRSRVRTRIPWARRLGTRAMGMASKQKVKSALLYIELAP